MAPTRRSRALLLLLLLACAITHSTAFLLPAPGLHAPGTRHAVRSPVAPIFMSAAAAPSTGAGAGGEEKSKQGEGGKKLVFKGLRSERFRHPLDQQATEQLRRLPGLEWVVRRLMRVAEEAVYLVRAWNRSTDPTVCRRTISPKFTEGHTIYPPITKNNRTTSAARSWWGRGRCRRFTNPSSRPAVCWTSTWSLSYTSAKIQSRTPIAWPCKGTAPSLWCTPSSWTY